MHRLATIHNVTDDDDGRNTVAIARPSVLSAKNVSQIACYPENCSRC